MAPAVTENETLARILDTIGDLLEEAGENPFRIRHYRNAASAVRGAGTSVQKVFESAGREGLRSELGIGDRLAALIEEYYASGSVTLLKELKDARSSDTRPEIEARTVSPPRARLDVSAILQLDEEYRREAVAGNLKTIAPRQNNPEKKVWLPIMTAEREGVKFTVMFSNTARAHELGKTDDWVVVYYQRGKGEDQCTVVTETKGALKGRRVVRGRERECRELYGA